MNSKIQILEKQYVITFFSKQDTYKDTYHDVLVLSYINIEKVYQNDVNRFKSY